MENKRTLFWDNFKGILIFLVVFGHFIHSYSSKLPGSFAREIYMFIYSFHMPAFVFCSGYFSKSERSRGKESLAKLFLYYICFNTLMLFFARFYMGSSIKILTPYYSYWYILSLIMWRALAGKVCNMRGIVLLSLMISLLLGYNKEFTNLLSLRRTVAFFPFFAAGYLLDRGKIEAFLARRKPWQMAVAWIPVIIVAAAAFWAVGHFGITSGAMLMNAYSKSSTVFHRILIFGISVAAIIAMFLVVPNCNIPLLSQMGRNSLLIYLAHRFVTIIYYKELFHYKNYTGVYILYALFAAFILCMILSSDRLNQAVAKTCDKVAGMLTSPDDRKSKPVLLVILCVFLGLLALKAF